MEKIPEKSPLDKLREEIKKIADEEMQGVRQTAIFKPNANLKYEGMDVNELTEEDLQMKEGVEKGTVGLPDIYMYGRKVAKDGKGRTTSRMAFVSYLSNLLLEKMNKKNNE